MSLRPPTQRDDPRQRRQWRIVPPIVPHKEGEDEPKSSRPPVHPSAPFLPMHRPTMPVPTPPPAPPGWDQPPSPDWDQGPPLVFPHPTPELPVMPPLPWAPLSDDDGVHTAAVDPRTIRSRREAAAMMADMLEGGRVSPVVGRLSTRPNADRSSGRSVAQHGHRMAPAEVRPLALSRLALALLNGLERRRT
jgi:hypothetical protein